MELIDKLKESGMKALTWRQPYLFLMGHGKIETRTWNTKYRGWVLMCAAKKAYSRMQIYNISGNDAYKEITHLVFGHDLINALGYATHIGRLVESRKMKPEDAAKCFVDYQSNLYCHIYEDVQEIEPIAWHGSQGFRNVHEYVIDQIKLLVKKN